MKEASALQSASRLEAPTGVEPVSCAGRNKPAKCAALQPLRGGRPAIAIHDGPLSTPCWIWQGSLNSRGYAIRRSNTTGHLLVHRAVAAHYGGPLASDTQVHHRCENKRCVSPLHLDRRAHLEHARLHAGAGNCAEIIFGLLADGPARQRDIACAIAACGYSANHAPVAVHRMFRRGEIVRVSRGVYALPDRRARALEAVSPTKGTGS